MKSFKIIGWSLLILLVVSLFYFFLLKFYGVESYNVLITELDKEVVHSCKYYLLKNISVLDCDFETKYGTLKGKILQDSENNIYLFRENPNQAIFFGKDIENNTNLKDGIYGFKFPEELLPLTKIQTNNTIIEFSQKMYSRFSFIIPEDTKYVNFEEMQINIG